MVYSVKGGTQDAFLCRILDVTTAIGTAEAATNNARCSQPNGEVRYGRGCGFRKPASSTR